MRKINKREEPNSLTTWKRRNPNATYDDLDQTNPAIRQDIRNACLEEQFYLCAYCCQRITGDLDSKNEHVEARKIAPQRSLDFSNIVASCRSKRQCDAAHGSQPLPLTPLMDECETEFKFKISGRVEGLTAQAKTSIQVLNLGDAEYLNRTLIEKRKQLSDALLFANGVEPNNQLEDEDLVQMVIDDIQRPKDGKLEPFAPVVANILRGWLAAV
ncbi:hypothetical protein [Undibacterium sp. Ren11W]|uniref:hypothetical protein n=1 Tax=Undibacterium sp. Ren11W TaxID=3413045 RepID=UPI003BEFDA1F